MIRPRNRPIARQVEAIYWRGGRDRYNTPMPDLAIPVDTFGDPFDIASLPLPRPAVGYGVQRLDTDCLLDRGSGHFLPVRDVRLQACFETFAAAHAAAGIWLHETATPANDHDLAIVPLGYDQGLQRPILILGVIRSEP